MGTISIKQVEGGKSNSIVYTFDKSETIDTFSNGMLTNNKIKGIIPHAEDITNEHRLFVYPMPTGIVLSSLEKHTMKRKVFLTILKNILDVLLDVEEYMLDIDKLMLYKNYIYVDSNTLEVRMIYISTNASTKVSLNSFLRERIDFGVFDTTEDNTYITEIKNFLNSKGDASVRETSAFINKLLARNITDVRPQIVQQPVNDKPQNNNVVPPKQPQPVAAQSAPQVYADNHSKEKDSKGKKKLFDGLFGSSNNKKASAAPSAFAGMEIPGMPSPQADAPAKKQPEKRNAEVGQPMPKAQPARSSAQMINEKVAEVGYGSMGDNYWDNDDEYHKTIKMDAASLQSAECSVYLEQRNGNCVKITKTPFFIGKKGSANIVNDYNIDNQNVSRNHAIIECINGIYTVCDNSSLNGTFVNSVQIVPNAKVRLNSGDSIIFANEEFKFIIK